MPEKGPAEGISSSNSSVNKRDDVDNAWEFLKNHHDVVGTDTNSVDINALRRKIDWHIVPLMFACYLMQFLDKVILNVGTPLFSCDTLQHAARLIMHACFFDSTLPSWVSKRT